MTRSVDRRVRAACACAAAVLLTAPCGAQTREDYARSLAASGDHYRAITVYKELAFFAKRPEDRVRYTYEIGQSYRLSARYEHAIETFELLLRAPGLTDQDRARIQLNVGVSQLALGRRQLAHAAIEPIAAASPQPGLGQLYLGVVEAEEEHWDSAKTRLSSVAVARPGTAEGWLAADYASRAARAPDMPHRAPWLAASMSAIIPGSGQLYSGHTFDALQAFGFVGAFGFMSYVAYRHDHDQGGPYWLTGISLSLTTLFHVSNIVGAYRTAAYFNQRQHELNFDDVRARAYSLRF